MKIILLLLTVFLFIQSAINAQQTPSKAKIYTEDNNVIDAFVESPSSNSTPQSFRFSVDGKDPFSTINSQNIKSVLFNNGDVFEKYFIHISVLSKPYIERAKNDYISASNELHDNVLVERILSGAVDLYMYIDKYENLHFFYKRQSDTSIIYLPNNPYVDQNRVLHDDPSYKNIIHYLAQVNNCSSGTLNVSIDKLAYAIKPMMLVFKEINSCAGSTVDIKKYINRKKDKISFGAIAGATSIGFGNNVYKNRSVKPTFGFYINTISGRSTKKNHFSLEGVYQAFDAKSDSIPYQGFKVVSQYSFSSFNLNPMTLIFFNKAMQGAFIGAGANIRWLFNIKESFFLKDVNGNERKDIYTISSGFQFGFLATAGYSFNRVSFEARYGTAPSKKFNAYNYFALQTRVRLNK